MIDGDVGWWIDIIAACVEASIGKVGRGGYVAVYEYFERCSVLVTKYI